MKRIVTNIEFTDRPDWGKNVVSVTGVIEGETCAFSTTNTDQIEEARNTDHPFHYSAIHKIKNRLTVIYNWSQNIECTEDDFNACF